MKALSIFTITANEIMAGKRTHQVRHYKTEYRGPVTIVAVDSPAMNKFGTAVGTAELTDCEPFKQGYKWVFDKVEEIKPRPEKADIGLYEIEDQTTAKKKNVKKKKAEKEKG